MNEEVDEANGHHVARWANGMVYGRVLLLVARTAMAYPLDAEGVWCEVSPRCNRGGPALFLDRDGVVVEEVDYLHRVEDIAICASAAAVISAANANAVPVVTGYQPGRHWARLLRLGGIPWRAGGDPVGDCRGRRAF